MGTIDQARGVAAGFRHQTELAIGQLQASGQAIGQAQVAFLTRLGPTSNPKVIEVEARCHVAKQKVAEAIAALTAARQAADEFRASLH